MSISINFNGANELLIQGAREDYIQAAREILNIETLAKSIALDEMRDNVYFSSLKDIGLKKVENSNQLLSFSVNNRTLEVAGDSMALVNLFNIFESASELAEGSHFDLFYYEENGIIDETDLTFTFYRNK